MPPLHDGEEGDGRSADGGAPTGDVRVMNLSAVVSLAAAGDAADLSSDTSATSIASGLSDGAPRPSSRSRARSASLSLLATPGANSGVIRPSSTPRSRPSSNPRTRTPLRRESPLPVPSGREDGFVRAGSAGRTADDDGPRQRVGSAVRRNRGRAGSIPEEHEGEAGPPAANDGNGNNDSSGAEGGTASRAAGRLLSLAARSAATSSRSEPSARPTARRVGLSSKQGPSRRKQRRWDNDRFVGTASERLHVQLLESSGGDGDYWTEHVMPNYPAVRTSHFEKLCSDETKGRVRERFVRGEVAREDRSRRRQTDGVDDVASKFAKMGVADPASATDDELGGRLARRLAPRIRAVVSRCASSANASESSPRNVVRALEAYLVSLALDGAGEVEGGYPPLQSDAAYDLFYEIFAEGPRVVLKDRPRGVIQSRSCDDGRGGERGDRGRVDAVSVPTVHFHFPDASSGGPRGNNKTDDERGRSAAFHRILLYAVCAFHGLETSSSVVTRRVGGKAEKGKGRTDGGERRRMKVVTVQGGVLLAPGLRVLDHCRE